MPPPLLPLVVLRRAAGLLGLSLLATPPVWAQDGPWALTNGRIETVTQGVIAKGTIVIRNGLIVAVGPSVPIPPDARVFDLAGKTVSPGLLDLTSTLGLRAAAGDTGRGRPGLEGDRLVADALAPSASDLKASRDGGVTAVLVAPSRGLFRGQSALVATRDSFDAKAIVRSPIAAHLGYEGVGRGTYPGSLMGVIAFQRQTLFDAARYGLILDRWRADPRGLERPEHDPLLEALVPVTRGRMPVFVDARTENEIRRADRLAREHGLALTVVGAVEGWRAVDALKGHGVAVAVDFPAPRQTTGWAYRAGMPQTPGDSAALEAKAKALIERNPAALHAAGVSFALTSGGTPAATFVPNLRKAVAAGLPAEVALAGATLRAAELAGVGHAMGSIEPGKIANLVVSTGPLLGDSSAIFSVFVDGTRHDVPPPSPPARQARGSGGGAAAAFAGAWVLTTNSPQGANDATLTVTQEGDGFTGTMTSDQFGSTPVSEGRIAGRRVSWTLTLSFGGQSFTLSYAGEVEGDRITGTVTAGDFGSFTFSGTRRP